MRIKDIDASLSSRPRRESGVALRAHSLADRHLEDLTPGELAFCLRQGIAAAPVADRALVFLAAQPTVEAELYPGDLLAAVLHAESKGWLSADQRAELRDVSASAIADADALELEALSMAQEFVRQHDAT